MPEASLTQIINEAKDYCIEEFLCYMGSNADQPGTHLSSNSSASAFCPKISDWLKGLESNKVVSFYEEFRHELTNRNGWVVPTNSTIHNCTGSSCNALLLGSTQQSTASLFYIMPYLCKNKVALQACLVALEKAQEHVKKFPSVAEDSGSNKRTVQHMFTRVVNELSQSIQISNTQVALSLLNMGTEITTDTFA